ncbi:MAG: glycine cleavage system aminomethyltransferase GcvT [Bacteroidetes bacterium]|nr:glycine cleavage system aminomethyltransferase GcvT [Bacteroidota bacterium]
MKETPFTQLHIEAGAKVAPFAGYNMPIQFTGINDEHMAVRENVGVFDVSHMGEVWVNGPKAEAFLQRVATNNVSVLFDGKAQYTCFPNGKGGIVDDFLIYRFNAEKFLLVINASNIEKDWNHLCNYAKEFDLVIGEELINASDDIAQLAVQGPNAMKVIQKLVEEPIVDMEYYTFKVVIMAGVENVILSATGYTGSGGCEIYIPKESAVAVYKAVYEAGKELGIQSIGLGARDTLRLEKGFCLYGNDIDDTTSPLEAGLGWVTKFIDGKNFVDRDFLAKQKEEGVTRKLVSFKMIDRGVPRHGYDIVDAEGHKIGTVTSGTMSPILKSGIGMGYVLVAYSKKESEIFISVRDRKLKATVVKAPFV